MAGPEGMPALVCPLCGTAGSFIVDTEPYCGSDRPCSIECVECCSSWTPTGEPVQHFPALVADVIARRLRAATEIETIPGQTAIELPPP